MNKYIDFSPGEETHEKNREWQGCPTIARSCGGRLFAGWYTGGVMEPCINNYNVLCVSDDNGMTWSNPILAIYADKQKCMRNIDIQLWIDPDGCLWVMWTKSPYPPDAVEATIKTPFLCTYDKEFVGIDALICKNPDADHLVFEPVCHVCDGFLRCQPIVLKNGIYVFPAYDKNREDRYILRFSEDKGKTFRNVLCSEKIGSRAFDETAVFEAQDGRICIIVRTNEGFCAYSESTDGGETWSKTVPYQLSPPSRIYIGRLSCGLLCLVRSVSDTLRNGIKVCLSDDDGLSWKWEAVLEEREMVSYPDLCEGENGELYIVYDRERVNTDKLDRETWISGAAKEILLARIKVSDIISGTYNVVPVSVSVISKAGINKVTK